MFLMARAHAAMAPFTLSMPSSTSPGTPLAVKNTTGMCVRTCNATVMKCQVGSQKLSQDHLRSSADREHKVAGTGSSRSTRVRESRLISPVQLQSRGAASQ